MQLLVPPLDDTCRGGDFGSKTGDVSTSNSPRARSVMSQGLQDKFETMKQAWNQSRAATKRSEAAAASSSSEDQAFAEQEDCQHEKKKRKVAMETAIAIESEVQKWQRGIAELEAMLDEASGDLEDGPSSSSSPEGEARANRPPEIVRFPSLPPIIPAEEGDFEESSSSSSSEDDDEDQENDDHCCNATEQEGEGSPNNHNNKNTNTNPMAPRAKVKVTTTANHNHNKI
mmetsp:Transcript_30408/g.72913  ORF Transcript_30408/g.72913 Transcript_30408/m.72913 type:complete len:229 (-) Transcript_30408:2757-3443(-)|eukprot:CAMPEP_0113658134 /NCGR_PEP_ID=MMETSP0017_2-20120614/31513_1 /TAXON_ID=2856 /ORGANISM="Cylindrotheca closterium" /LENGTH=228 /DNA_ID=CAMNT_0000572299 /DNA_START=431 /DNA_END=1117 /DNA_ORIENTATION=- /assembly_acc=CAM_ASM_000147